MTQPHTKQAAITIATPRTDDVSLKVSRYHSHDWIKGYQEMRAHAQSIERELAKAKQEMRDLIFALLDY